MVNPTISIIVAVFNAVDTVERCIVSLAEQDYPDKEIIVMDGASSDGTVNLIQKHASSLTYWESTPDRGIAHAWNKALARCHGQWILFLGADDRLAGKDVLSSAAEILLKNEAVDVVYGQITFEGGPFDGQVVGFPFDRDKFLHRMTIPHTAAFHNAAFVKDVGTYDESYKIALDYEYLLRKPRINAFFFEKKITVMSAEGISSRAPSKALKEAKRAQLLHRTNSPLLIQARYLAYRVISTLRQFFSF